MPVNMLHQIAHVGVMDRRTDDMHNRPLGSIAR